MADPNQHFEIQDDQKDKLIKSHDQEVQADQRQTFSTNKKYWVYMATFAMLCYSLSDSAMGELGNQSFAGIFYFGFG